MSIKELIDNHYKGGKFNFDVSQEELSEFVREFMIINELKEIYTKGESNRKELGQEILTRADSLKSLMNIFERSLSKGNSDYEYPEYISDYNKAFELLLALSNKESNEYILKKFYANQLGSFETRHGDRESLMVDGEIWVIGRKDILNCIDNTKPYYGAEFVRIATKLVNDGNSLAMITNHYYENNVMPQFYDVKGNFRKFSVAGLISDLRCYTFEDELESAVDNLSNYIDVYGGNIENIPLDTLVARIKELGKLKGEKVLSKTK